MKHGCQEISDLQIYQVDFLSLQLCIVIRFILRIIISFYLSLVNIVGRRQVLIDTIIAPDVAVLCQGRR